MNPLDRLGEVCAKGIAIGKAGESVVLFEIAELRFGLAPLPAPHPGKGGWDGETGTEQEQHDCGHPPEIA